MRKSFYIAAAIVAFIACSKQNVPNQNVINNEDKDTAESVAGQVMHLFADYPNIEDGSQSQPISSNIPVKASAIGSFSWQAGDKIAIPIQGGYAQFEYNETNKDFEYTLTGDEKFINGTAYYPASVVVGGYSTDFNDTNPASSGFKMEASYTTGCSEISFEHKSALINLNFTNVPPFATSVHVKVDGVTVATVALPVAPGSTFTTSVPVTPVDGSASYSFALMENSNVLREVSKSVSLNAGKYYLTPDIAINKYIVLSNAGSSNYKLGLQKRTGDNYTGYDGDYSANYSLNTLQDGKTLYLILPDWYSQATAIKVILRSEGGADISSTERIFLDRNPHFDISENSMKTNYRVYYSGTTNERVHVYYDSRIYVWDQVWSGGVSLYYWNGDDNTGWNDGTYANSVGKEGKYNYFIAKKSLVGKTVNIRYRNPKNLEDNFLGTLLLASGDTYVDIWWNSGGSGYYRQDDMCTNAPLSDTTWPGVTPEIGSLTNLPYYEFPESVYGNDRFHVIFNNVGTQSTTWGGTINEDGFFSY